MNRETILQEAKAELERHVWGTFVEGKASVALGGTGVIVAGCEACRKRFGTNSQYLRHLADDVLPGFWSTHSSAMKPVKRRPSPLPSVSYQRLLRRRGCLS
jgi:hypothetical protein